MENMHIFWRLNSETGSTSQLQNTDIVTHVYYVYY